MSFGKRATRIVVIVVVLCVVAMGALYAYISSGGLIARKKPSVAETMIARLMVRASVPQASKMLKNPLVSDSGGEDVFTHFADGTGHKNRMQGNDFVTSLMYTRGVTCFSCHDAHCTDNDALLWKPANVLCLDCHGPNSPNGPHAPTIEQHTHHKAGSQGSECIACHMPKIQQTIVDVNVRSHTFQFVPPATTDALKIPNACNVCHSDKSTAWAKAALKTWADRSPWRVAE